MIKNFLFFFGTGLITPLYYALMVKGKLGVVLSIIALATAFASLYLGKLADKVGVSILFYIFVPISTVSVLFLNFMTVQVIYGVSIAIIGLLININTSNQKGGSGFKFGKLSFYIQIAFALSLLVGGYVESNFAITAYITLMAIFLILEVVIKNPSPVTSQN